MMDIFYDRTDAGKRLGKALRRYRGTNALVLGIPRGGVEIAYQAAKSLAVELSILIVRKLPFPDNPESGFGAIAEDGSRYYVPSVLWMPGQNTVDRIVAEQQREAARRVRVLRHGRALPDLRDRQVIIADDGLAMGSTAQAAVRCCRNLGANRITVASPVASRDALLALESAADETVILLSPSVFHAVADFYQNWNDVSDEEVIRIMSRAGKAGMLPKHGACAVPSS